MKRKNQQVMTQRSRYQVSGPKYSHLEQRARQMDDERTTCLRHLVRAKRGATIRTIRAIKGVCLGRWGRRQARLMAVSEVCDTEVHACRMGIGTHQNSFS